MKARVSESSKNEPEMMMTTTFRASETTTCDGRERSVA